MLLRTPPAPDVESFLATLDPSLSELDGAAPPASERDRLIAAALLATAVAPAVFVAGTTGALWTLGRMLRQRGS